MTLEEMQHLATEVAAALNASAKISEATVAPESDYSPGEPIPIYFDREGDQFVLSLNVL